MTKFKLLGAAVALTFSTAATAVADDCCRDMACCEEGADCCDDARVKADGHADQGKMQHG